MYQLRNFVAKLRSQMYFYCTWFRQPPTHRWYMMLRNMNDFQELHALVFN